MSVPITNAKKITNGVLQPDVFVQVVFFAFVLAGMAVDSAVLSDHDRTTTHALKPAINSAHAVATALDPALSPSAATAPESSRNNSMKRARRSSSEEVGASQRNA